MRLRLPQRRSFLHAHRHAIASALVALVCAFGTFFTLASLAHIRSAGETAADAVADALPVLLTEAVDDVESAIVEERPPPPVVTASYQPPPPPAPHLRITRGVLGAGETLVHSLEARGVDAQVADLVRSLIAARFDFGEAKPGQSYRLAQAPDGRPVAFRYSTSLTEGYQLRLESGGYTVERFTAPLEPRVTRIAGVITTNLYEAIESLGERKQLANDYADVFAWDVDFARSVRHGDEFRILYERLYYTDEDGNDFYVRPGRILAAQYSGHAGEHTAVYFQTGKGRGGYFRPDGTSVKGRFLLAPVRYSHISSGYSKARLHPILNITRPHQGVDYAAPTGTPVWAVADGEVIYRGWAGGFGNLVKLRHTRGYVSYYAHLSRFGKGLEVGDHVQQKQVIGYVGQTGLATGPHVCFRVAKNGHYVNPLELRSPDRDAISPDVQHLFRRQATLLLAELDSGPLVASGEAL